MALCFGERRRARQGGDAVPLLVADGVAALAGAPGRTAGNRWRCRAAA